MTPFDDILPPMAVLSFVIATFDRPVLLERLLTSLAEQWPPNCEAQIVVVDNHPSQSAATIVTCLTARVPALAYVFEPVAGLSRARNAGCAAARGEYLLFIDDDAVCPPGFVDAVVRVVTENDPDLFGGPVDPLFEVPPPSWFPQEYETRRHATCSGFSFTVSLSGANFGIRRDVLTRLGGFDPDLGMVGGKMRFLEERALLDRYRATTAVADQRIYYDLDCVVLHATPPSRIRFCYQLRRQFRSHYERAIMAGARSQSSRLKVAGTLVAAALMGLAGQLFGLSRQEGPWRQRMVRLGLATGARLGLILGATSCKWGPMPARSLRRTLAIPAPHFYDQSLLQGCFYGVEIAVFEYIPLLRHLAELRLGFPHLILGIHATASIRRPIWVGLLLDFDMIDEGAVGAGYGGRGRS